MQTVVTPVPAVSSTDLANDVTIRLYGAHSGSGAARIDKANLTGTYLSNAFTLYEHRYDDRANGVAAQVRWGPSSAGDGANYQSFGNWSSSFAGTRYIRFVFPSIVPSGATITGAQFVHAYRSATAGDTTCWYFEAYDGTNLIGTHGSAGSPVSCNATTGFVTETIAIPEVNTVSEANNLVIRIYARVSGNRRSQHDAVRFLVDYWR